MLRMYDENMRMCERVLYLSFHGTRAAICCIEIDHRYYHMELVYTQVNGSKQSDGVKFPNNFNVHRIFT